MQIVNINQAKTNLSYFLNLVQKGKRIVISKRNVPIAEIRPFEKIVPKRKIGQSDTPIQVPDSFFDPLPDKIINAFNNPQ